MKGFMFMFIPMVLKDGVTLSTAIILALISLIVIIGLIVYILWEEGG